VLRTNESEDAKKYLLLENMHYTDPKREYKHKYGGAIKL
jgi:hypothetical protein